MATSMRSFGNILARASNCLLKSKFTVIDSPEISRVLFAQPSRERHRTCKPPTWWVRRRVGVGKQKMDGITAENREFLREVAVDTYLNKQSPLKDEPWPRNDWTAYTKRTGLLAVKIGIIPQWTKTGERILVTLLQVLDNHVINYTSPENVERSGGWKPWWKRRYGLVVVGALSCDPFKFSKPYNNLFEKAGVPPKRKLTRYFVTPDAAIQPGTPLTANHFRVGDFVDVQAKTIDHGFEGVMKRHKMKGMPATHGTTRSHRKMGATGGGGDKGNIWKGKKMPGHMGADWTMMRGLKIWRINTKHNVLYVQGHTVPGPTHCFVRIMDTSVSYKRNTENPPNMPTTLPEDLPDPLPEELFDEQLFCFTEPTIAFDEKS